MKLVTPMISTNIFFRKDGDQSIQYSRSTNLTSHASLATSKTWTQTLELDPGPGPWISTPDLEPWPWTRNLDPEPENLDPENKRIEKSYHAIFWGI